MKVTIEQKEEIYLSVAASATLRDATYWLETIFSAGIATLGLVLNSPAVIIGAMLISPLMGPIMAGGLALAAADFVLAVRAVSSVAISSLVAVGFSTFLVTLLPFREMTAEIAARTSPNTLDLGVALLSGAVGAIAVAKHVRGVATSIPGVAIAVALMPPLCVAGYGVGIFLTLDRAQGESVFSGGVLLFLTNLIAITFASMLVFLALRIDSQAIKERIRTWRATDGEHLAFERVIGRIPLPAGVARIGSRPGRIILAAAFLLMVAVPLTRSFNALREELTRRQRESSVQKAATNLWQQAFATSPDGTPRSFIDSLSTQVRGERVDVDLRIFTSRAYSPEERLQFMRALSVALRRPVHNIDMSLTEIPTSKFEVATRTAVVEPPAPAPKPRTFRQIAEDLHTRTGSALGQVVFPPHATLHGHQVAVDTAGVVIIVTYLSETDISADAQALIAMSLQRALGDPAARVILNRETPPAPAPAETGAGEATGTVGESPGTPARP